MQVLFLSHCFISLIAPNFRLSEFEHHVYSCTCIRNAISLLLSTWASAKTMINED